MRQRAAKMTIAETESSLSLGKGLGRLGLRLRTLPPRSIL